MKLYVRLVVLSLLSILIYIPVVTSDHGMLSALMDGFQFYFSIGACLLLIVLTIRDTRKIGRSILIISLGVFFILSPRLIDEANQWRIEYKRIHQDFTSETLRQNSYDNPGSFTPPMKNVKIELKEGHIYLEMEFDSEQPGRKVKTEYGSDEQFSKDMIDLLDYLVRRKTEYTHLKQMTMKVKYKNNIYIFENIPLKDAKGRPFDQSFIPLLKEKMKVIPSAE
ncbi:hypothetical protein [Paenibacillus gansuensis]|uniref:Uncharacterized protein n=1 Tax=Paenibacillus gansuensis TaxID=306542 RepID=A0ABW5P8F6_9BACL